MDSTPKIMNPEDRFLVRDFFWSYPQKLVKVYRTNRVLSLMLLMLFVSTIAWSILKTDSFVRSFAPKSDNTLVEATVGKLGSLNPMFASQNHVDRDLDALIYQKFIYIDQSGNPLPGIAESWDSIIAGKHYKFYLNRELRWSDGEKLTADDVIFTFNEAVSLTGAGLGDSIGSNLKDIKVEKVDDYTVEISLSDVNSSIFETLSVFIIPEHIVSEIKDEDYLKYGVDLIPVGSGLYRVRSITDSFVLLESNPYSPERPKIKRIKYMTFPSIKALEVDFRNNLIDTVTGVPFDQIEFIDEYSHYERYSILIRPRKKVLFFNLRDDLMKKKDLRIAISESIDKSKLVSEDEMLGEKVFSSIPSNSWAFNSNANLLEYDPKDAKSKIKNLGYKLSKDGLFVDSKGNVLELRITYLDTQQNRVIVDKIQRDLTDLGLKVLLDPQSYDSILNETIATRNYQILLFEVETSIDPDQYSLWHSSKVKYPDLNLSGYSFATVDLLLERSRITMNKDERANDYRLVQRYLSLDAPAVFLYEPYYNYLVRSNVKVTGLDKINLPSDRFRYIVEWEFR